MATEIEGLSLSSLDSMRNVMELLNDMLQAMTPGDSLVCATMFSDVSRFSQEKKFSPISSLLVGC